MDQILSFTNEQMSEVFMSTQRDLSHMLASRLFDVHKVDTSNAEDIMIRCNDGRVLPFNPFKDIEDAAFVKEHTTNLFGEEERMLASLAYYSHLGSSTIVLDRISRGMQLLKEAKEANKQASELMPLDTTVESFLAAIIYPIALLMHLSDFDERVRVHIERRREREQREMLKTLGMLDQIFGKPGSEPAH